MLDFEDLLARLQDGQKVGALDPAWWRNLSVAGVDEVGIGPLAGPVVAAAVVLPETVEIAHLRDSKATTLKQRERASEAIRDNAVDFAIGLASEAEIDELNILRASHLAMQRAVAGLRALPDLALIDGNKIPKLGCPAAAIINGDQRVGAISAASIVAKVYRDNLMLEADQQFPSYGFAGHKGYPTAKHLAALRTHGPCRLHRRSFAPVRRLLENGKSIT